MKLPIYSVFKRLLLTLTIVVLAQLQTRLFASHRQVQQDNGLPTALELATSKMKRIVRDVWVARIAPGLWVHTTTNTFPDGTIYPANGMLLETSQGAILFDTGWSDSQTETLLDWARQELKKPVTRAIISHAHEDRLGGIAALNRKEIPSSALTLSREIALQQNAAAATILTIPDLQSKAWRDNAGFELFYAGAGHARDNIAVWFPQQKVLFGGCLIKSVTSTSLGNIADAVLPEWTPTIKRLQQRYKAARIIVPGHGTIQGDGLAQTLKLLKEHKEKPAIQ